MQHSTFILGLTSAGQVLMSVVYDPFTDKIYHAVKGGGAFCNDKPIRVNDQGLNGGYILIEQSAFRLYESLQLTGAVLEPCAGAGYRAMLLASGLCSAIVQGKADNHDIGPASLIVEEAGGKVTSFDGRPIKYDQPIIGGVIVSNGICHEEVMHTVSR
jgi:myo-inositol-1(or 4)-monophosphatase